MAGRMSDTSKLGGKDCAVAARGHDEMVAIQKRFSAHMRNPEVNAGPAFIESRRLKIYSDLVYNNIERLAVSAFPVVRSLYGDKDWQELVRNFICIHSCQTPYFTEWGGEFINYLENEHPASDSDQPFLLELARYEWAASALFFSDAENPVTMIKHDADAAIIDGVPHLSPLAWPMVFSYPVHKIGQHFQPHQPSADPVCLVVYRNRADQVRFLECNAVTGRMLELLEQGAGASGRDLLQTIAIELRHPELAQVIDGGRVILEQLHSLGIIYYLK